ncbi:SwmB domain-containing protein [Paenibacillus brevis]|uniref:S-layer homology domain-containing protein n=1 Tax=Paenibacillus brevis TaxID=2841508 RepID=A0ABS6FLM2_9BACL|nr:SwmB domain-containing protein [Paenibacillus brevis]MBU5670938.1 S-layer homology domain-containing protein [Paenibacillus brevis]
MKKRISTVVGVIIAFNMLFGTLFGGIGTAQAASVQVTAPTAAVSPTGNNVPIDAQLWVKFAGMDVRTNGKQTYTISRNTGSYIDKAEVTVTQDVYTDYIALTPPTNLLYGTTYTVTFPEAAFIVGDNGTESPRIEWSFTTMSGSSQTLAATSFTPSNGSSNISANVSPQVTFNRNVKLNPSLANGGITLRKTSNSAAVQIKAEAVNNYVKIDPLYDLEQGSSYYIEIPNNGIADAQYGNYYGGLSGSNRWTFTTASIDKTAPVLQSTKMYNNTSILLTYNEALSSYSAGSGTGFTVTVNGEERRISYVNVSGYSVYVNLETGVAVGQDVKISYSGQIIRDAAGNPAASFSSQTVTNGVDSVSPKPRDGYASTNSVTLYFSDSIKSPSKYAYEQFKVMGDDRQKQISSISHSGSTITLYLSNTITNGEVIKVSYQPGSYPLQDYRGWEIAAFSDYFVRNYNDTVAPIFKSAEGSDRTVILNYNEALGTTSLPAKSQFSVLANNAPIYVNAVEIVSNRVILTLASSFTQNQNVTVSYVPGTSGIADLNGNRAGYINLEPVAYKATAEGIQSISVTGDLLTIVYTKSLKSITMLPVNQFSVKVDNQIVGVVSAAVSGNAVTLKLGSAVRAGQVVSLSYLVGASPLYDIDGNLLKSYTDVAVVNTASGQNGQITSPNGNQPSSLTLMSNNDFGVPGYLLSLNGAQTSDSRSKYGEVIKRYTIDNAQLQASYKYLRDTNATAKRIIFEVPSSEKAAEVAIPIASLMEMYTSGQKATFAVKYNTVLYDLPLEKVSYTEISRALVAGNLSNVYLLIQLAPVTKVYMPTLNSVNGVTISPLTDPVQIDLSAYSGTATQTAAVMASGEVYIKASPNTYGAETTLIQYDLVSRVPAYLPSSKTNVGSLLVFKGKVTGNMVVGPAAGFASFPDLGNHWASKDIKELASKLIIGPQSNGKFEPNKNITRGEFATYIVKGLGLSKDVNNAQRFPDVVPGSEIAAYIGAAAKAGIINGNTDGTFKPNNYITREQMALMMVRAMEYSGYSITSGYSSAQTLSKFKDSAKVQAKDTVAKAVNEGVIQGISVGSGYQFQPAGNASRAQAAVMLKRVLDKLAE